MNGRKLLLYTSSTQSKEPNPSQENVRKDSKPWYSAFLICFSLSTAHGVQNLKRARSRVLSRGVSVHTAISPMLSNCVTRSDPTGGKTVSVLDKYVFIHSGVPLPNHGGCEMKQMARLKGALLCRYTDKDANAAWCHIRVGVCMCEIPPLPLACCMCCSGEFSAVTWLRIHCSSN